MMTVLHSMNSLRVPLVRDSLLCLPVETTPTTCHSPYPLEGYHVLDVGCGAGFLSEVSGNDCTALLLTLSVQLFH